MHQSRASIGEGKRGKAFNFISKDIWAGPYAIQQWETQGVFEKAQWFQRISYQFDAGKNNLFPFVTNCLAYNKICIQILLLPNYFRIL